MHKSNALCAFLLTCVSVAALAQNQGLTSPLSGVPVGKVTVVTLDGLDAATRSIADRDLNLQKRFATSGEVETVPDDAAYIKTHYASRARYEAESKIQARLKAGWTDISRSELRGYKYQAFVPEGPTKAGPWSSYTRVFTRPDGALLMLHEWDYALDGGGVVIIKELMNERVHQSLARLVTRKTNSGQYFSELTWATDKKYYTLTVWDRLDQSGERKYDKSWLVGIAEQLTGDTPDH